MKFKHVQITGREVGALRGLVETGTEGVALDGVPQGYLVLAQNVMLESVGSWRSRPGTTALDSTPGSTTAATWLDTYYKTASTSYLIAAKGTEVFYVNRTTGAESSVKGSLTDTENYHGVQYGIEGSDGVYVVVNGVDAPFYWVQGGSATNITLPSGLVDAAHIVGTIAGKLLLFEGNLMTWSEANATLAQATEFQDEANDISNFIWFGPPDSPVEKVSAYVTYDFQGLVFTKGRTYVFDGSDPANTYQTLFADIGCIDRRAVVAAEGAVFWCSGDDVWMWARGMNRPQSMTRTDDGVELVQARFRDTGNDFSACAMTYDPKRRLLIVSYRDTDASHNDASLVYDFNRRGWVQWTVGAKCFAVGAGPLDVADKPVYLAGSGGVLLKLDDDATDDNGTVFEVVKQGRHLSSQSGYVQVKGILFSVRGGQSSGDVRVTLVLDGENEGTGTDVSIEKDGIIFGTATAFFGNMFFGSELDVQWFFVGFRYASSIGRYASVKLEKTDGNPIRIDNEILLIKEVSGGRIRDGRLGNA